MSEIIKLNTADVIPERINVLEHQGIPHDAALSEQIENLISESYSMFENLCDAQCIFSDISINEFERIYDGEGNNADDSILQEIYPEADALILFALTMGENVSDKINELFAENDYPLASMLDSVASMAADKAVELMESMVFDELAANNVINNGSAVLGYSPGYCGWDITGQKKLFEYLNPNNIGITINKSCLMTPIKSVSGILIAGDKDIHRFEMGYSYCAYCKTQTCLDRIGNL